MRFTINPKVLKAELDFVQRVIEKKTSIPILANVLINAANGGVTLTGTNLDQSLIAPVNHEPLEHFVPGSACVNADTLAKMTNTLKGDITFSLNDGNLTVQCGAIDVKIPTRDTEDFPIVPSVPGPIVLTLDGATFRQMVKDTIMCVTADQSRFTLSGGKLESDKKGTRLVATDGHRLAYTAIKTKGKLDAIIPLKALTEAARMANCVIGITADDDHVCFSSGGRTLITRKLSGKFPDYKIVIPKDNDKIITFNIELLKDAIKRAAACVDKYSKAISITFRTGEAIIKTQSSEEYERTEIVPVGYASDEIQLGFNVKYLGEFLNSAGSGNGRLSAKDAHAQVEFTIDDYDYDYKYIVMPIR